MAKTILIVDDSATMLMSLKSSLSLGGYQVEPPAMARRRSTS
jgi:CheY-like chemotaxis protein